MIGGGIVMFFFHHKEKPAKIAYDPSVKVPALRCSICTGEQVTGFKNLQTGKFEDYELVRTAEDVEAFMQACGVQDLVKIY